MRTTAMALVIGCGMACGAWGQDVLAVAHAEPAASKGFPVHAMAVLKRVELKGGLIVEDLKLGEGYEVNTGGAVVAHYRGSLKDDPSTVFDSSFGRGEPGAFALAGTLPGWESGIPGMKVGGIRRLTVPAAMAKGANLSRPEIPADSDLVYVIELVDALQVEDVKVGAGELTANSESLAFTAYSITDKNGKVVEQHSARELFFWVPGEYRAMALGLEGMKVGGKRRIQVPAAFNESDPRFGSGRPAKVPVTIEVELIGLRNLPRATPTTDDGC